MATITIAEYDELLEPVRNYIAGFNEHDVEKFKAAFDKDAWIFYIDDQAQLHKGVLDEKVFEGWAQPHDGFRPIEMRVLSVVRMGDAANVVITCGEEWRDFHSLVRVDGTWRITNKTASHSSR